MNAGTGGGTVEGAPIISVRVETLKSGDSIQMRMRLALRGEEPGGIREKALQSRAPEWAGWIATGGGLAVLALGASSSAGFWFARSGRFNDRVERSARDISGLSDQVAREVAVAVTTMQFHDMVTQVIEHLKGRADLLSRLMSGLI